VRRQQEEFLGRCRSFNYGHWNYSSGSPWAGRLLC